MWPWINSWIVPPYETSIVQDGFFVRFCPFDRMGRVLSRDDIMRDRLYVYALTTFPINMAATLTAPAPVRNPESGEEADAEVSEDALSPRTAGSADTDNPTPSCESDVSPVLTISSTTSLHAGAGAENSALHPMRTTQEIPPAQQDAADEECNYKSLTPSCKAPKLPVIEATQNKHACLTPHSKFLKKQRASRHRAVLSDDALHTDSTEAFVRKKPHLTRSNAIKAMRSYRLDKWLEQQDRSSSTSSVLSPSPAPSSTITWTPIPGFPPNSSSPGLRDAHPDPPIRPRALLFEPEVASNQTILYGAPPSSTVASSAATTTAVPRPEQGGATAQNQDNARFACTGGMQRTFRVPVFEDGTFYAGPLDPYSALAARKNFLVFCFSEAGFLGNKTLALRQPIRESMSQLARGWRYYPKTMVLTFASLSIPNAASCIADRQNLRAVVLLLSFHLGAEHGTLTLFSPEIVPFQSDDWTVIRAMRACWLPPKLVSEMCCRWICGIPRILNGKYVFIALDDVDITPAATVKVHFGAFINLSLASQVGRSIEIHSPLLTVSSESASTDPTFCNWQSGREHLAPPELAEDAFFWMRAGQLRPSHTSTLTSARTSDEKIGAHLEIQAGGKRALRTQALPAFNFSTAVFVIGEEGHHGTLLLPGFASEEAIILQVAAKIRPRSTQLRKRIRFLMNCSLGMRFLERGPETVCALSPPEPWNVLPLFFSTPPPCIWVPLSLKTSRLEVSGYLAPEFLSNKFKVPVIFL